MARDISQGFTNRAYSVDGGNDVKVLCEDCADEIENVEHPDVEPCYLNPIEEYEEEGNRDVIASYRCERCGAEQQHEG
jgi:hypothetical protein